MACVYYIGDEATAAGYRLAGAEAHAPPASELTELFRRACASGAEFVLLSGELAALLPAEELDAALLGQRPLVAVVPDACGTHLPPDLEREVRLALGIEP